MTNPADLRELASGGDAEPPFGFGEFERRRATADYRHRAGVASVAASVGVLGLVALLALVTQRPEPAAVVVSPAALNAAATIDVPYQPALVDLGQFAVTSELEDHIALLDAQISAAHVYAAPAEQLRQLQKTREQLNVSLQRVSYAQALLSF